jgi:hypothetical protein
MEWELFLMFISSRKSSRALGGDCMSLREGDADA